MDKFCKFCGAELNEDGVCPDCTAAQDEPKVEASVPETTEDVKAEAPVEPEVSEPIQSETVEPEPEQSPEQPEIVPEKIWNAQQESYSEETVNVPPTETREIQPTKFYYAFRQIGNVLKHFFSKHTIDAISAQYAEILPIWVILLPVCAIISALSMTLSFDATHGLSIGAGSLFSGMKLSGLEVFVISFAMSVAVEFVYSIAVMVFFRTFKVKTKFKAAANLTMSAYIAVTVMDLFNIITIGTFKSESTTLSCFGMIAFILLLYLGITNVLKDKKPFWSFFLTMTCASLAALVAALVVTCPIIVMRGLQELANTTVAF